MNDPLHIDLGDRGRNEIIDLRPGRAVPIRTFGRPEPVVNEPDDLATLVQYLRLFWSHKWILLLAMTLGAIASLVYVLRITPLYTTATTVEILKPAQPFGKPLVEPSSTQTEIQLLMSSASRSRAVGRMLGKKIKIEDTRIVGPLASLRKLLRLQDPAKTTSWEESAAFAKSFLTVNAIKDSDILSIQTFSPNPQAAAEYTIAVAEEFIATIEAQRTSTFDSTTGFMDVKTQDLKSHIESSQRELAEFAKTHGLTPNSSSGAQSPVEEKLKNIQTELLNAQATLYKAQSAMEARSATATESDPAVIDSGTTSSLQAKLADLMTERANLLVNFTEVNPKVQAVDARIKSTTEELNKERRNVQTRNQIEYKQALMNVEKFQKEFEAATKANGDQSQDRIHYNILQTDIESSQRLYDTMLAQGKEASIAKALHISEARVVDRAGINPNPTQPDLMNFLSLGMLSGLVCGAGIVILRSRADLTIQAPGFMEIGLNIRELGVIPSARTDRTARKLQKFSRNMLPAASGSVRIMDSVDCLEMVARSEKPSIMAEAFRSTMTSILYSEEGGVRPKVLVFTSASSGEGKSTIISNLAIALAQIHQKVLLIDADMRLPRIHEIFDVPNSFGLSDILHEQKPVEEYVEESLVRKTHIPYLYVLPAGPARAHLSRLFHSMRMQDLMLRFRDTFDVVLIDTAPVLVVPDPRILARSADAVVLVVRAHQTHQDAAFAAASRFASDGTRILGTILNDWNPDKSTNAYGPYYTNNGYYTGNRE